MTTPVKTPRRASAKVLPTRRRITERKPEWPGVTSCGRSAVGSASPCQGEGRGFESRRPLDCGGIPQLDRAHAWSRVRFPSPPRAISSAGERYLDTVEVTGSIPVSRTNDRGPRSGRGAGPFVFDAGRTDTGKRQLQREPSKRVRFPDAATVHTSIRLPSGPRTVLEPSSSRGPVLGPKPPLNRHTTAVAMGRPTDTSKARKSTSCHPTATP